VPSLGCLTFGDLAAMTGASNRPSVHRAQVAVMTHEATCSFLPEMPASPAGAYTVTLRWDELMLPRSHALVRQCIAPKTEVVVKSERRPHACGGEPCGGHNWWNHPAPSPRVWG
jgi:hypothetical protein